MPADVIAHPFRFAGDGRILTVPAGSDAEAAQAIVAVLSTVGPDGDEPGERDLVPGFGLADPTYGPGDVDVVGLEAQLALYGPADVAVDDVTVELGGARAATVTISYANGAADAGP